MENLLIGRNPVIEALKSGREINKILVAQGISGRPVAELVHMAKDQGIPIQEVDKRKLDQICAGQKHQGIVAYVAAREYVDLDEILAQAHAKEEPPFLLVLDELEDPHNFGSILRSCDGAGVHGVIIPKRRSVSLTETVAKTSAGAIEYVPVARVTNIAQTLDELKQKGLWVVGLDVEGKDLYWQADLKGPIALVIGSEGKGIGKLIKSKCDFLVKLPMLGQVNSLNASVAAGIVAYEIVRQRLM